MAPQEVHSGASQEFDFGSASDMKRQVAKATTTVETNPDFEIEHQSTDLSQHTESTRAKASVVNKLRACIAECKAIISLEGAAMSQKKAQAALRARIARMKVLRVELHAALCTNRLTSDCMVTKEAATQERSMRRASRCLDREVSQLHAALKQQGCRQASSVNVAAITTPTWSTAAAPLGAALLGFAAVVLSRAFR